MGRRSHRKQAGNRDVQHLPRHFEWHDGHLCVDNLQQPERRHEDAHSSHASRRHPGYDRLDLGHEHGRTLPRQVVGLLDRPRHKRGRPHHHDDNPLEEKDAQVRPFYPSALSRKQVAPKTECSCTISKISTF